MSLEADLRDTSDRLLDQLDRLTELESAKRDATPGSPEFVELSRQVEGLAAEVFASSQRQTHLALATKVLVDTGAPGVPAEPIAELDPARDPHVVLAEWRDAERRLSTSPEGSAEHDAASKDIDRLRDEYRRSFEARR